MTKIITYEEWMDRWEAAVLDGQSSISRSEAERRYFKYLREQEENKEEE